MSWVPLPLGKKLRNLLYRHIFARIGSQVRIQPSVWISDPWCIEIEDEVQINRYVHLHAAGHRHNKLRLSAWAHLDHDVDTRCANEDASWEGCRIEVGAGIYIGPYTCIGGPGPISIGRDCLIGSHSGIYANNHNFANPTLRIKDQGLTCKGIKIGDDCWLGSGVRVLDGVTLGQGSVVGAGAVVTKDIPPYSVAVGVPAKVIAQRQPSLRPA